MKIPSSFRSPRFATLLLLTLAIAFPIVLAGNRSASASRKPAGSSRSGSTKPEGEANRMERLLLPEVGNDTSPPLHDMVQVPVTPNEVRFGQSSTAQEVVAARVSDSGAILVAGISPETRGEVGATQRVQIANKGYQIFDNLTGTLLLGPSDISTIWAGFGGSCETGGAGNAVVLYDKVADRWVISQFASATGSKAVTEECFAVSTSSDATGSYYRYAFHLGANFIDSPHLSVQADGYLMGDSVYNESVTERLGNQFFVFDRTAMLAGTAATFSSPGIDNGVGETYSISADGVRITSEPNRVAVTTLTINLTYDPDSTFTGAGLTAADIVNMKAANAFAAAQFTNNFHDPVNVNIQVTAVPGTGTLGGSSTFVPTTTFANMVSRTSADATSADDATTTGAGGSIPAGLVDPVAGAHVYRVSRAQSKALGLSADDAVTTDGTYTFGGGQPYTYDPNNRAVAGRYDYIGVSMHEFSEIMGRIPFMGEVFGGSASYMQFDLFHYTGAGTRGLNDGPGRSFSFNNGTSLLKAFNNAAADPGTDLQDWASGTFDSFNARSNSGVKNDLTAVDLQVMDVIGYDKVAGGGTPPANDNFASTQVISGNSGSVSGTNVNATKESGEPNHAGNAGGKSVWYRWQAPNSGTATITTTGSDYDTLLGVYTGSSVGSLTTIAGNDDDPNGGLTSRVTFTANAGTTYQIAVDGYNDGSGNLAAGNITLNWNLPGGSCTAAQMTSPTNGSTIAATTTFTWNTGTGNTEYWLQVGTTGVGSSNLYSSSQLTGTSRTLSGLPSGTIYVRLSSRCGANNTWSAFDYTYTGPSINCTAAQMTSPTNGSSIAATTTFTWNTGTGNAEYWLQVGTTGVGSNNLYSASQLTGTSRTLSGLPSGTIYVRLSSRCGSNNTWSAVDYSYTLPTTNCTAAQMTSPANGSTIAGLTNFTWNAGTGNTEYWLQVGTTGVGSNNLYSASQLTGMSRTLSNLPSGTIYVRLSSRCGANNAWSAVDYTYTGPSATCTQAQMTSPANGSTIATTTTFTWNTGTGNTEYWLQVGTTGVGSNNLYSSSQLGGTSRTLSGLPGGTIYVRLSSRCGSNNSWSAIDYTYTGSTNCTQAQMTSPTNGSTIAATTTFTWNTGTGNTEYWLQVGTTGVGSNNLYSSSQLTGTSRTLSGLPSGTIYVRLSSRCGGDNSWSALDYSYIR